MRDVRFFPDGGTVAPPQVARDIVQGKSYDLADPSAASYFAGVEAAVPLGQTGWRQASGDPALRPAVPGVSWPGWPAPLSGS